MTRIIFVIIALNIFFIAKSQTSTEQSETNPGVISIDGQALFDPEMEPSYLWDFTPQISFDIDNDGAIESLQLIAKGDKWGIDFCKKKDNNAVWQTYFSNNEYDVWSDSNIYDDTFEMRLHDFDSDGVPEILVTRIGPDASVTTVLKLCGAGVDLSQKNISELSGWLRHIGDFFAFYNEWSVDGNLIRCRSAQSSIGNPWSDLIYLDNKLRRIER